MKINKKYLKWCTRQKKEIQVLSESTDLNKTYLKKSKQALSSICMEELRQAKEDRVEMQYCAEISIDSQEVLAKTKEFVLKIEKIIDGLNPQKNYRYQKRSQSIIWR